MTIDEADHGAFEVARVDAPGTAVLPEAFAPMIFNCWYVVGEAAKIARELTSIRVLGEPLVMYRSEASGEPVVLDDRCAHRRFPLSKSRLVGDTIQCGYHGFTYEASGRCTWAPGLTVKPKFGVRRYPAAERGPWVWVWMGDPERADPATIPLPDYDGDAWHVVDGYRHNPGNYMLLIENLLDMTHLHFLHGASVADLSNATAPVKTLKSDANCIGYVKAMPQTKSGIFAEWCGGNPEQMVYQKLWGVQYGPSLHVGGADRATLPGDAELLHPSRFIVRHCITPEDEYNTHQFYQIAVNAPYAVAPEIVRDVTENIVFEQDVTAIRYIQAAALHDRRSGIVEHGIAGDRFGLNMRRILRQMKRDEQATVSE